MSRLALRSVSLTLLLLLVTSWSAMAGEPHHRHADLSRLGKLGAGNVDEPKQRGPVGDVRLAAREKDVDRCGRVSGNVPVRQREESAYDVRFTVEPVGDDRELATALGAREAKDLIGTALEAPKPAAVHESFEYEPQGVRSEAREQRAVAIETDHRPARAVNALEGSALSATEATATSG